MNNTKTILILTASPKDTARLRLNEEVREIEEGLKLSINRDQFVIRSKWAVRLRDLRRAMLEHEPRIVHFCGHGEENGIKVEDERGNAVLVNSHALAGLFGCFSNKVECVILNACYSQSQAEAISKHIPYVIGMNKDIQDNTAVEFAVGFYDALGAGKSIEEAFMFGRNAIALYNIPEYLIPCLISRPSTGAQKPKIIHNPQKDNYREVVEVANSSDPNDQKQLKKMFPYSFDDFPDCLFKSKTFDVGIIVGSGKRGYENDIKKFRKEKIQIEILGESFDVLRNISSVPITDLKSAAELAMFLGFQYSKLCQSRNISYPDIIRSVCFKDIAVPKEILKRNLIIVGDADVNMYAVLITLTFQKHFKFLLPIRFFGDEDGHFTSNMIVSKLSDQSYSGKEDSSFMHSGYVLMTANPWAPEKVVILCVGVRTTGTAAALLSLQRGQDWTVEQHEKQNQECKVWHYLSGNNRCCSNIPGKIVRATKARIIEGQEFFQQSKEETEFEKRRLPQRFMISDFEFLE